MILRPTDAEVFTLVRKRELKLAALALKSLLHHRGSTRLCVTAINDGSLTSVDKQCLDEQTPSLRWQSNGDLRVLESDLDGGNGE